MANAYLDPGTGSIIIHALIAGFVGAVFVIKIYRRINKVYADDYEQLMFSGLYNKLVENHLLIPHIETKLIP